MMTTDKNMIDLSTLSMAELIDLSTRIQAEKESRIVDLATATGLTDNEVNLIKHGCRVDCIKSIRARLQLSLADSKCYMERALQGWSR